MRTLKGWGTLARGLAVTAFIVGLAGCGSDNSSDAANGSSAPGATVTSDLAHKGGRNTGSNNTVGSITTSASATTTVASSASGTVSATRVVDSSHNVWTVSNGVISKNGAAAGYSANVVELAYVGGTIYQENTSCLWWSWNGSAWVSSSNPSPNTTPSCSTATAAAPAVTTTAPTTAPTTTTTTTTTAAHGSAAALLAYLNSLTGQHVIVGQHTSYWDSNPMDVVQGTVSQTGKTPAILGTTTGMVGSTENGVSLSNSFLAQGGIPLVSWWPADPITGQYGESSPMSSSNFASLIVSGSSGYVAWHKMLDAQIAQLKQINGPVIYRPMMEMEGSDSWWKGQSQATYIQLWQQMHDYFVANGVTNVLWHWCPDANTNGMTYYPGDAYVDIVGGDLYMNGPGAYLASSGVYASLASHNKPIIMGEVGVESWNNSIVPQMSGDNEAYLTSIRQSAPKIVGLIYFCQNWAIPYQQNDSALMNDPSVIALNNLPSGLVDQ
jgi:hypothetical protein